MSPNLGTRGGTVTATGADKGAAVAALEVVGFAFFALPFFPVVDGVVSASCALSGTERFR